MGNSTAKVMIFVEDDHRRIKCNYPPILNMRNWIFTNHDTTFHMNQIGIWKSIIFSILLIHHFFDQAKSYLSHPKRQLCLLVIQLIAWCWICSFIHFRYLCNHHHDYGDGLKNWMVTYVCIILTHGVTLQSHVSKAWKYHCEGHCIHRAGHDNISIIDHFINISVWVLSWNGH